VSIVPQTSLADVCTILQAAAVCPVRLTLLRQRRERTPDAPAQPSSTTVDLEQDQSGGRSSRLDYTVTSGTEFLEPPPSGLPSHWRSEELIHERAVESAVGDESDGRQRSQSFDDVSRDLPLMLPGSPSGTVGVHSTYIDLSTVIPATQSTLSEQWNDNDSMSPAAAFYKTQSSPTLDRMPEFPTSSSTQRLAQSVDELHSKVRRGDSPAVQEDDDQGQQAMTSVSSSTAVDAVDSTHAEKKGLGEESPTVDAEELEDDPVNHDVPDNGQTLINGNTGPALPTPLYSEHSKEVTTDNTGKREHMNKSSVCRQQVPATARDHYSSQPLRTTVDDADMAGLERAMRAPERSAAGGLAYYINLEEHHFSGFPGHLGEGKAHSADELRTS